MTFSAILTLACGLAMDAAAVAAARGLAAPRIRPGDVALVAGLFGGAQALMPMLGWVIGAHVGPAVQAWDHWIAFVLLGAIGGKMLWEARPGAEMDEITADVFGLRVMIVLAIATSIDAFAVGLTLPMLHAPFMLSVVTIGVTTAILSGCGLFVGRQFGAVVGKRLDAAGGIALISLGTTILVQDLYP